MAMGEDVVQAQSVFDKLTGFGGVRGNGLNTDEAKTTPCRGRVGLGEAAAPVGGLGRAGALMSSGCAGTGETFTPTPGDVAKPTRACLAVAEATPLAMSPADRRECEATMGGWYAETWYPRADPADRYKGEA